MSRKGSHWNRDELTGLPSGRYVLNPSDVKRAKDEGCDLWCVRTIAYIAGGNSDRTHYFETTMLAQNLEQNPEQPPLIHAIPIRNREGGAVVTYATRTNSAQWGGEQVRTLAGGRGRPRSRLFRVVGPEK